VAKYVTTANILNKLINNVNITVSMNKTYQSYTLHMFMNAKEEKMTKKELQSRGNQRKQGKELKW